MSMDVLSFLCKMWPLITAAFLLGIFTRLFDQSQWLKEKPWRLGILFGLLGIAANAGHVDIPDIGMAFGLQNVPAALAVFFFGPWAGLIAGAVTTAGNVLGTYSGLIELPDGTAYSSLIIAVYAVIVKQWVLDGKKPSVLPAMVLMFFGEIVHVSILFLIGAALDKEANALVFLADTYPLLPVSASCAAGLAAVLFSFKRGWKEYISVPLTISLLCILAAFVVIEQVIISGGYRQTKAALQAGTKRLKDQFCDQIDYRLRKSADLLAKQLKKPEKFDTAFLQQKAEEMDVDEINVLSNDGKLIAGCHSAVQEEGRVVEFPFPGENGSLQLVVLYDRLKNDFPTYFFPMFNKAGIENGGFFLVTEQSGKIVAGHNHAAEMNIRTAGMDEDDWNAPEGETFETKLFGKYGKCYRDNDFGKWRFYAFLPYTEFFGEVVRNLCSFVLVLFAVCIAFRAVMLRAARIQKKIDDMQSADLELASTIQNSELPEKSFENDVCRIHASMTPAKEVGGDFYDHYVLPDGRIAVTIADVSGKGVPAAIFMMKAKNTLKELVCDEKELTDCVEKANMALNKNNYAAMFVTAWAGIFDPASGTLKYVSAGHNPPLILRKNGTLEWLNKAKRQKPLAAFPEVTYQAENVRLVPGDRLFLYTDGVTEATDIKLELYGNERLENVLKSGGNDLIGEVTKSLKEFTGKAPVADDITILTLEVKE